MSDRANPRLADAESPYIEEAATQPVDWHTWGEDVLEKAQAEDKPILVDSGAVWCHWCHVMDHESYEDPETAELINELFVPVKLDRDERPDVDRRLQKAVGALTGRSGWPLTAFLTPEGEVYFGGTYFPRESTGRMPAFKDVLRRAAEIWEDERDQARQQADKIREALEEQAAPQPGEVHEGLVEAGIHGTLSRYDPAQGGFGNAPKFPHATAIDLLITASHSEDSASEGAWKAAAHTLEAMREGGIWDHLGGGFHRYSTDEAWHVPHFEKMLYDNAQLLGVYARAAQRAQALDDERAGLFESTARDTRDFLREVLEQDPGGFGGSVDADRRPEAEGPVHRNQMEEGDYFTWTLDEVEAVLDDEQDVKLVSLAYGVEEQGDMEHAPDRNVLHQVVDPEDIASGTGTDAEEIRERLDRIRQDLLDARSERDPPPLDRTVYTDWNGLAVESLLQLDAIHEDTEARAAAMRALDRLLDEAFDPERGFAHALTDQGARVWDLVEDQTNGLPALIAAYQASLNDRYLDAAEATAEVLMNRFLRDDGLLRFNATEEDPAPQGDQPTPSPAASAALHLPRLARLTGREDYREAGEQVLEAIAGRAEDLGGVQAGTLFQAIAEHVDPSPHVVVTGQDDKARELVKAARRLPPHTTTIVQALHPTATAIPPEAQRAAERFEDASVAIVCRQGACQVAETVEELAEGLG